MVNPDPTTPLVACQDGCGRMYAPVARGMHLRVFHSVDGNHPVDPTDEEPSEPQTDNAAELLVRRLWNT